MRCKPTCAAALCSLLALCLSAALHLQHAVLFELHLFCVHARLDQKRLVAGLNITDLLAGGGTALVWKQEKSPFDDTESLTERIVIQATNVAVALLHVDNTVLAWAVDMATGAPVPDAQVALHSVEFNYQTSNVRPRLPIRTLCRRCLYK